MARVRPILDRIAVLVDEEKTTTDAGIILMDRPKHEHPPKSGLVVAVGPGLYNENNGERIPMNIKVGDRIQFEGYAGKKGPWDEDEVTVITEPDVLFVFESEE